ncbi:FHA domain-containing protein [Agromyces sp. LHK192]|uniref:FHA domain-containing protein n=1 Tax=Agromyces sp. LHK192 TaxID=2498704 RepID=UPI000FDC88CD|nr:FHA domain-containing protein [Agromyces sp. LHK192]
MAGAGTARTRGVDRGAAAHGDSAHARLRAARGAARCGAASATDRPQQAPQPAAPEPAAAAAQPEPVDFAAAHTVLRDPGSTIPGIADIDDDDYESTVVVDRRPRLTWTLVLDDGTTLALTGDRVLLGRNPAEGPSGEQRLPVPDSTRTLSKTHARLDFADGRWTITDLGSTNGVLVERSGEEELIDAHVATPATGRFVLGEVGMRIESGSAS